MTVEKLHHPFIDLFPINLPFTLQFGPSLPGSNLTKGVCLFLSLSTGNSGTTGIIVETLQKKKNPTDGRGKEHGGGGVTENKSEGAGIHSMESSGVVSKSPSSLSIRTLNSSKTTVSKKICQIINKSMRFTS